LYLCHNKNVSMKKTKFLEYYNLFIGCFWAILFITLWVQFLPRASCLESFLFTLSFTICAFMFTTYASKVLLKKALLRRKIPIFLLQTVIVTLLLAFSLGLVTEGFYFLESKGIFPVSALISETHNPLYIEFLGMIPTSILVISGFCGLEFFREHARQEKSHLEEQLLFLRNQVNPHMMFNVLNHIHILMQKNVDMASELLISFSDILRYQLYECNNDMVLLQRELKYIQDVVEIEKLRWGNELNVDCQWEVENDKKMITPFVLISFIENAFKHVSRMPSEKGYVNISVRQKGEVFTLMVENSKTPEPPRKKEGGGLGLLNATKRLSLVYPDRYKLNIHNTDTVYRVHLEIKLS
ncbi:MAG: histidine kinase, partial [Tannerellaceae bacterium]|nr:histidine kinase [Tannerellaceae bacterium]